MITANTYQLTDVVDRTNKFTTFPREIEAQTDHERETLLAVLTPDNPWGERQNAARKLGHMRDQDALPGLLAALPTDPFWMVRCTIIQALEVIGDPGAIPTLQEVAIHDGFQVVREYATEAIERLTR